MTESLNFDALKDIPRLLIEVDLTPVQGDRFQPTGFPDIGAAEYTRPDGTRMLLVESAQSMANHLEKTILKNGTGPEIIPELIGLPYIVTNLEGATSTKISSLTEAHRINSPFIIKNSVFMEKFAEELPFLKVTKKILEINEQNVDWHGVYKALLKFDINSLIHGIFFSNIGDGRIRFSRALTGFIEAENVKEAYSGGAKFSSFDPKGNIKVKGDDKKVYSNVPFPRVEYTAEKITAYYNLDLSLLRNYNLGDSATNLLIALSLYKIRRFLKSGLRPRTACDLCANQIIVKNIESFEIPEEETILKEINAGIEVCKEHFADPVVTELTTETEPAKKDSDKDKIQE